MEGLSSEFGTHNSDTSTHIESPFSAEFPPLQMMTFAAATSTTPTPTKPRSANKRPTKRPRAPIISTSPTPPKTTSTQVISNESPLISQHFEDYKCRIIAEFKSLYQKAQKAKRTYTRMSNLNSHNIAPHSLRIQPPRLVIKHEDINKSLHLEFASITTQYSKDLTIAYVKHLDSLVHYYTKIVDDFPTTVRTDILRLANLIKAPACFDIIEPDSNPNSFSKQLEDFKEELAINILKECNTIALSFTYKEAFRTAAMQTRDKTQLINDNTQSTSKHHIREIDLDMESEDDIEDDSEKVVDSFEKAQYDKFQFTSHHNNLNLRTNPNSTSNSNPNPNSKKNPNPNPNSRTNPNPNPNPNHNLLRWKDLNSI